MSNTPTEQQAATMLKTMAKMQDGYNQVLHAQWREQGFRFYRAIWVECAEMLDHYGWKWWKHATPDLDQVKLELVDIWHFGMSDLMRDAVAPESLAAEFVATSKLASAPNAGAEPEAFRDVLEAFALRTLADQTFARAEFNALLVALPLPLPELFSLYVGKNVLNGFRQDNGYRTGEYRKLWGGREDNEHLVEALEQLQCAPDEVPQQLYAQLEKRYSASA